MEFLIVAGLALVGYAASREQGGEVAYTDKATEDVVAGGTLNDAKREDLQRAEKQWKDAMDPHRTGVIAPSYARIPKPYWSSVAKQTTNEKLKQTRMELFTGATNLDTSHTGTYRAKHELPAMFSPTLGRMAITSGGTGGNAHMQLRMPYVSGIQQGVLPTSQVQVGRGVGVGMDVPAADGFHPSYRPLPKNVNAYRKNNLPGRAIAGSAHVSNREQDPNVEKRRPETFWAMDRRPLAEGKFVVDAHMRHAVEPRLSENVCGGHYVGEETFGNPAYAFNQTRVADSVTDPTRPHNNRNRNAQSTGQLNLAGDKAPHAMATAGCPASQRAVATWDCARIDSQQREAPNAYKSNLRGPDAHMTMAGIRTNLTHRDNSTSRYGALGAYVPSGTMENLHVPEVTLRDQVNHSAFGDAAPILPAQSRQGADKQLLKHAKRSEQLIGAINPPLLRKSDVKMVGAVAMRKSEKYQKQPGIPTLPVPTTNHQVGHLASSFNKLPVANPWVSDLNLAKKQLATNALAQDIS